jgi:hypothetical protein
LPVGFIHERYPFVNTLLPIMLTTTLRTTVQLRSHSGVNAQTVYLRIQVTHLARVCVSLFSCCVVGLHCGQSVLSSSLALAMIPSRHPSQADKASQDISPLASTHGCAGTARFR